ncbi:MAG: tetratricopeptide repeat protein [Chloroflexota bacterium]
MKTAIAGGVKSNVRKGYGSNLLLMVAVAMVIAGLSVAGASIFAQKEVPAQNSVIGDPAAILASGAGTRTGYADRSIETAQAAIKLEPNDFKAYASLGFAFQQKARETNDPTYYAQAEDALTRALGIKPDYYDAMSGMGQLNLSRHEFGKAEEWGQKAQALQPSSPYAYGVIGDAQIELGQYDAAIASFQQMVDLRPDLGSYSRVSYARELYGDVPGAIDAMQKAVVAGGPAAENTAWCRVQLGNLYFNSNQLDKAEAAYSDALAGYPNYLHALAGLAQVRWAQGRTDDAIKLYKGAVATVPLPQYLTSLGDLLESTGDRAGGKEQLDLVLYIFKVFEAGGVNVGAEKAAFLSDHQIDTAQAVTLAEEAARTRQDIHTMDTLAWAYYQVGRYQDAHSAEQKAMRLGTQNALFFYHMGMIQSKLGDAAGSQISLQKALQINPHFSIKYSKEAAALVRK